MSGSNRQHTEALLRSAMEHEWEVVMSTIDVERGLATFQERQRRRSGRRRAALAAAAAVAVLAAAGGAYAVLGSDDPPPPVAAPRALAADELTRIDLPGNVRPTSIDIVDGQVVVTSPEALTVLDAEDGEVVAEFSGGGYGGPVVVAEDGEVWTPYEDGRGRGYARLDLEEEEIVAFPRLGVPYFIAAGGGGLWAVGSGQTVVELEPQSGDVLRTVTLPFRPFGLAVTDDAVWAQEARGGRFSRVEVATGDVTPGPELEVSVPFTVADGDLWVPDPVTATVVRFDGSTGEELGRTTLPGTPPTNARGGAMSPGPGMTATAVGDDLYVASKGDQTRLLTRIEMSSGTVLDVVDLGPGGSTSIGADDAAVYVAGTESHVDRLAPPERD